MSLTGEQVVTFIKKNPVGVGCGVLCLAVIAAIYLRSDYIPKAQQILDDKGTLSDRYSANKTFGKDLPEQLQQLDESAKGIADRLAHTPIAPNQQYFYALEAATGTKISITQLTSSAKAKTAKTTFVPILFSVGVQGTFEQELDFLHRLESGAHFCRILNASCSKTGGPGSDLLTLNLSLELLGEP